MTERAKEGPAKVMTEAEQARVLEACALEAKMCAEAIRDNTSRKIHFDFIVPVCLAPNMLSGEMRLGSVLFLTERIWRAISQIERFEVTAIVSHDGWLTPEGAPKAAMVLFRIHLVDRTVAVPVPPHVPAPVA